MIGASGIGTCIAEWLPRLIAERPETDFVLIGSGPTLAGFPWTRAPNARVIDFDPDAAWNERKQKASGIDARQIDVLIADRTAARTRKDFAESDRIRDQLATMGIVIKDSKEGTTWEVAR